VSADPVDWLYGLQTFGIKLGLDGIRALLTLLDHPEGAYPAVLIGGSNGKGSVAAMVDAVLRAHGLRTGLYTSPHLVRPSERIRIMGADVAAPALASLLRTMRAACDRGLATGALEAHPSFFEVMTAAALCAFREAGVDAAVLEVGLGGRLDATNATEPLVAAIVTVDLDHIAQLGGTLASIAGEKAGIARAGRALVSGVRQPEALAVLRERCAALGSSFVDARSVVGLEDGPRGSFAARTARATYDDLHLPLAGAHQRGNAQVAIATLEAFADALPFALDPARVREGLAATRWPGRLQLLAGSPRVLLDGAHNPAGTEALAAYLAERQAQGSRKPVLIFGAMADKDVAGLFRPLASRVAAVVTTRPCVHRAMDAQTLAEAVRAFGVPAEAAAEPAEALALARGKAGADGLVLVAGSLYLVGSILALLEGGPTPGPVAM
jgi:dihydrofolate synthase / folylpolyglutamate synthase